MLRNLKSLMRPLALGVGALAVLQSVSACAYNATGALPRRTLIFEASVAGNALTMANNLAYYFVLDTNGNPSDGPLVNGPAPFTFPYPDPRSYLPFVREDITALLDQDPSYVAPPTFWSDFFWLSEEAGQFVMWQGRVENGIINERYRQLQSGREWGIKDGKTIQITLPFNQLSNFDPDNPPAQIEANLAVATRALGADVNRGFVIDKWLSQVPNQYFAIQTRPINQNLYDTVGTVANPQNLGGVDPASVNFVSISYRVVFGD